MAYISHIYNSTYVLQLGDGTTPTEVFTQIGTINTSKNFSATAETSATPVRDLDNHGAPMKTVRKVVSTDSQITGSGQIHTPAMLALWTWFYSGAAKSVKFGTTGLTSVNGGIMHSGKYVLTALSCGGETDDIATVEMTLEQADQPTVVAAT